MSSAGRPELFLDRSLGRITATGLREAGYVVHLIADHYPDDASDVPDEEWIAEGCAQGWVLLTKDKRIRYRAAELEALQEGHLFCLVSGNLDIDGMTQAFLDALPTIEPLAREEAVGFWHVYRDGQVKRMWP
jgi:hypothetical protein